MTKYQTFELNKLEEYLNKRGMKYTRNDIDDEMVDHHQLIVLDENGDRLWDAICHFGSYGYRQGLLEIMGTIVNPFMDGDTVVGYLTANEVIDRIEEKYGKQ